MGFEPMGIIKNTFDVANRYLKPLSQHKYIIEKSVMVKNLLSIGLEPITSDLEGRRSTN